MCTCDAIIHKKTRIIQITSKNGKNKQKTIKTQIARIQKPLQITKNKKKMQKCTLN